jgi:hypothetical protein
LNELACARFAAEFGRDHVYIVSNKAETSHEKHRVSGATSGRVLFEGTHTIDELFSRVFQGASAKTTELTSEFGIAEYKREHPSGLIIFAVDDTGRLRFPVHDEDFEAAEGWQLTALAKSDL